MLSWWRESGLSRLVLILMFGLLGVEDLCWSPWCRGDVVSLLNRKWLCRSWCRLRWCSLVKRTCVAHMGIVCGKASGAKDVLFGWEHGELFREHC